MFDKIKNQFEQGLFNDIVRHCLTALGTLLVANGVMQNSQMQDFLGSGFFLANLAWQWYENRQQGTEKQALKTAVTIQDQLKGN